ncbi:MAG: arginine decarboxylase, pyruvoyl-dependent [Lachnospiraceae bacterium]|nr:arginine decarboxylase, pyruvoyl-dependent [Lachnospiraceae bacterium]
MIFLPKKYIMRTGVGYASHKLGAFDCALIEAGVHDYNLIKVSSILPPDCEKQNTISLVKGALLPSAFTSIYSNTLGECISAAIAIGIPANKSDVGVIMEHSSYNSKEETEEQVRNFAEIAMNTRNILVEKIVSCSIQIKVETEDFYCAFATVSMW